MRNKVMFIVFMVLFISSFAFCDNVCLWRYTDKITGEERGICYSDKDGNPQVNKDWNVIEITEGEQQQYIDLKKQQQEAKPKVKSDIEKRVEALEGKVTTLEHK